MIAYGEAKSRESKKKHEIGEKKWEAEISFACKLETTAGANTTL